MGDYSAGTVKAIAAADTSVVIAGTTTSPTIATGTLDVIAADHPPAAAVAMNAQKVTGLANGTAGTDAAAFGQIVAAPGAWAAYVPSLAGAGIGNATTAGRWVKFGKLLFFEAEIDTGSTTNLLLNANISLGLPAGVTSGPGGAAYMIAGGQPGSNLAATAWVNPTDIVAHVLMPAALVGAGFVVVVTGVIETT